MEILKKHLEKLIKTLSSQQRNKLKNRLDDLISVYPFNEYEYIISSLLGLGKITLDDYLEIRDEYIARTLKETICQPNRTEKGNFKLDNIK